MERQEVLNFLEYQLKKLKNESHVAILMKENRVDELEQVATNLDFSILEEFHNNESEFLELEMFEIPEECYYELAFYISKSDINDDEIFLDYNDFIEILETIEEELAQKIANVMSNWNLCSCSIEELISGNKDEC